VGYSRLIGSDEESTLRRLKPNWIASMNFIRCLLRLSSVM
jgi:hypothetical protein